MDSKVLQDIDTIVDHVKLSKSLAESRYTKSISYYIDDLQTMSLYLRWIGWGHDENGNITYDHPQFVISTITIYDQGKGIFSQIIERLKPACLEAGARLVIENVLSDRLVYFLFRNNFIARNHQMPKTMEWHPGHFVDVTSDPFGDSELQPGANVGVISFEDSDNIVEKTKNAIRRLLDSEVEGRKISFVEMDSLSELDSLGMIARSLDIISPCFSTAALMDPPEETWKVKKPRNTGFARAIRVAKKSRNKRKR